MCCCLGLTGGNLVEMIQHAGGRDGKWNGVREGVPGLGVGGGGWLVVVGSGGWVGVVAGRGGLLYLDDVDK